VGFSIKDDAMLVLGRNTGQSIFVGTSCTITLREATRDEARILVRIDGKSSRYVMHLEDTISLADGAITVMLIDLKRGGVKLGICAPKLDIWREELKGDVHERRRD
jgi:sRNA-binding carbon storage regulator CsrA